MGRRARFERLKRLSDGPFPALTIRYARRYLANFPRHGPAWMLVGIDLVSLARYEEAEQAFAKALEFCSPNKRQFPLAQMGHLFRETGDYEQAAVWYQQAIEADPENATFYIFLGSVRAKQGRFHDAEEAHRAATRCVEGCIDEAYLNLGLILRARERFLEAAMCFREALRLDPEYRAAWVALRDVEKCIAMENRGS